MGVMFQRISVPSSCVYLVINMVLYLLRNIINLSFLSSYGWVTTLSNFRLSSTKELNDIGGKCRTDVAGLLSKNID